MSISSTPTLERLQARVQFWKQSFDNLSQDKHPLRVKEKEIRERINNLKVAIKSQEAIVGRWVKTSSDSMPTQEEMNLCNEEQDLKENALEKNKYVVFYKENIARAEKALARLERFNSFASRGKLSLLNEKS